MKGWQITSKGKICDFTKTDTGLSPSFAKVKIRKVLLTENDLLNYCENGDYYPIVPGRFAVGQVIETGANCFGHENGEKVYISSTSPCKNCHNCKSDNEINCSDFKIAGENANGNLVDFGIYPCELLYTLPKSVNDDAAIYIEYVALALSIIDKLNLSRAQYVLIYGGNFFANILAQLIIYYKSVPIIVDSDENNLLRAEQDGIYYTLKTGADLTRRISDLTGGRMCERVVYLSSPDNKPGVIFQLASHGGIMCISGFNAGKLNAPMTSALKKQLSILSVNTGINNIASAINALANKAVDFSRFKLRVEKFDDVPRLFKELAEDYNADKNIEVLIDLI